MVNLCQQQTVIHNLFFIGIPIPFNEVIYIFQFMARGGVIVTTVDQSDIRGLGTE
jgi:hypothetical protein